MCVVGRRDPFYDNSVRETASGVASYSALTLSLQMVESFDPRNHGLTVHSDRAGA